MGTTARHVFALDPESKRIRLVAEADCRGRLASTPQRRIVGPDGPEHLWVLDPPADRFHARAVQLPPGHWSAELVWATDTRGGLSYTADARGPFFSYSQSAGFRSLGQTLLAPTGAMANTADGRVFGFRGADMAKLFSFHPHTREQADLGVAASAIGRRRYGYALADAVTGRHGEIVFGENDNGGHLRLYFPRILARV